MNYRHAFHAGNHADVFKHATLTLVLERLCEKPTPFAVLDTHAGAGVYDLTSEPALETGEFEAGVGLVFGRPLPEAPRYLDILAAMNPDGLTAYPGSPEIVRRSLRDRDRLILCELHPEEYAALRARYRRDPRIAIHNRDGYEAVGALLPPKERRGLVLIDPPYERPDETDRLIAALHAGLRKWPTGVFMAWYPVTDGEVGRRLAHAATEAPFPKALQAEFLPYRPDDARMAGGGLVICNAPYRIAESLEALCQVLARRLGDGHATWTVRQVTAA